MDADLKADLALAIDLLTDAEDKVGTARAIFRRIERKLSMPKPNAPECQLCQGGGWFYDYGEDHRLVIRPCPCSEHGHDEARASRGG